MAERSPDLAALDRIMHELQHAERKHPGWHEDPLRQAAVLVEEAGEVLQATLNMIEDQERRGAIPPWGVSRDPDLMDEILKEVAQTGAMALRYLINHERKLYAQATGNQGSDQAPR